MQKTWRASDVILLLLVVVLGLVAFIQTRQADRLYDRLDTLINDTKDLRGSQNDLQLRLQELSTKVDLLKGGTAGAATTPAPPVAVPAEKTDASPGRAADQSGSTSK
jgi:uncharacterized protein YlxW (UPF0749 family)